MFRFLLCHFGIGLIPAISDLDGDGQQEILAGHTIYSPSGEVVCTNDVPGTDGFTAAADMDLDDGTAVRVLSVIL